MKLRILSLVAVVVRPGCLYLPRICIYSFMRLRTYTMYTWSRLGEQLRWCWTICHSSVFIADIHICVPVRLYIGIHVRWGVSHNFWQTQPKMCLCACACVFSIDGIACQLYVLPLLASIWDKDAGRVCICMYVFLVEDGLVCGCIVNQNVWQTRPYMSQPRPGPRVYT